MSKGESGLIIISDTSVISNLILIDRLDILRGIFSEIIIPTAVKDEQLRLEEYDIDLTKFKNSTWITVKDPSDKLREEKLLASLDKGEAAAITLAYELPTDYLAIDEKAGRKTAKSLGIKIIGLIGILIRGRELGTIDKVKPILDKLIAEAHFYVGDKLYNKIIDDLKE